ncbi:MULTISPECIES: GIY-YIG nuclease family protein [Glutamicibacter]|uniref:GIY-YIG nuclease family protein n=1 Tax=Glutamicibacter TaxID=1742989 RepID=UPI000ED5291A|nr:MULTISPECIES: GIY-YIG nuclease family protein [Glutamicibacter]HCJ55268.1 hypothetical protein [Glutamicibacter sp.]
MTVYLISEGDYLKIGYTSRSVEYRIKELQTGSPRDIRLVSLLPGADANVERELHKKFAHLRIRNNGEWFSASPMIEAEFAKRRAVLDAKFRREEAARLAKQARQKAIANLPDDVRARWRWKRFLSVIAAIAVGLIIVAITPKEPMALWGSVRLFFAIGMPIIVGIIGRKLPETNVSKG